ncbi:MAG TPA: hypothetical protein PKE47_02900, partial [Verrucomicrobiota bacterium]|nr:hypothetical protein [Verrucomicrobiota bacterium]
MKTTLPFLAAAALLLAAAPARAALVIPGADGSDGALHITNHTVIDLSQAITGAWDTNNAANAGRGVYDPEKWAVVFKYTDVNIAAGTTVTFTNHPTRAPVVWLVNGNVTISGALDLNGKNSVSFPGLAEPGPGGFRGGSGYYSTGASDASGFGPGAGLIGNSGSYGSSAAGMRTYRNPSLLPLVGGSGGSGMGIAQNGSRFAASGGGGGGAILIACQKVLQIDGRIRALGGLVGFADNPQRGSGNGSGGGVRMVCAELDGTGMIDAIGGNQGNWGRGDGGLGRIRVERSVNRGNVGSVPDPSVIDLPDGATALLWPPAGAPEVRILSIG